jgi:long-chain acyl-CoA synthetase
VLEDSALREDVLATAERSAATVIYGSPFHFAMLSGDRGGFVWPSLRLAVATAAALPEATARAFEARFGRPLTQGLGIIEVGLPVLNLESAAEMPESLGRPLPAYEVALLDEEGRAVAEGEAGEFHVRGPGFLDAYLVPWNAASLTDGWFASGDLVRRDADGDLFLMGRKKSVINVAGMKVFPEEVERVLNGHPAVKRSRVFGREHPHMGQVPVAEIIPNDPENLPKPVELQRFCKTLLSAYKVPMQIKMVEALPLTASGKIRRTRCGE